MKEIMNVPAYASNHFAIVAREVEGQYWFYGAYDNKEKAAEVAREIKGVVFYQK